MGFFRNLLYKRLLGPDYKAFKANNEGVIGQTVRWFCEMYSNAVNSDTEKYEGLRDLKDFDSFIIALEEIMNDLITARYYLDSNEDHKIKEKFKSLDNSKFGAYSFLLNLFRLEIEPEEYSKIDPQVVMGILSSNFEDAKLPNAVVKGQSLDNWDIIEIVIEYF